MAALVYVFVILIGAASVMFGLDLIHAPLRHTPNVPIGRAVSLAPQAPASQRSAKEADDRELTPIYPTKLASGVAPQDDAKAIPPDGARGGGQDARARPEANGKAETDGKAEVATMAPALDEEPAAPQAVITRAAAPSPAQPQSRPTSSASCNVQGCDSAYRSFRASDCTYQPMSGPRRACTIVGGLNAPPVEQRARPQQIARPQNARGELREVERIVRKMTPDYEDNAVRFGEGRIFQDDEGRIFIVRRSYR
jgi:hypothetical protein